MDAGQFQIPGSEQVIDTATPEAQLTQEVDASFDRRDVAEMNEMHPNVYVETIIEPNLEMYHANATEANLPKSTALDVARAAMHRVKRYL